MKNKTLLLATGFVDGRGGSKMVSWFYDEMKARGVRVIVATNSMYKYKLNELGVPCDITIDLRPEDSKETIYEKCVAGLRDVPYDAMVSIGWRTYWPYDAYKKGIPYVLVDGGIPSHYGGYPTEFIKEVYKNTALFLMTTWFPWVAPKNDLIPTIKVVTQPYPYERVERMKKLRTKTKQEAREALASMYPIVKEYEYDTMVYLNMSDAYVDAFNHYPNNRNFVDPYGHLLADYMDFKEIEPSLFFLHNLIAGFETNYPGKVLIYFMQEKTLKIAQPILDMCRRVKAFAPQRLDLDVDPLIKKAADINICRATNCDNQADLSLIGEPCVTSVVPRNYMDEDTAAVQAEKLGICHQIHYDDPDYMKKLFAYTQNKAQFQDYARKSAKIFDEFWKHQNFWTELENVIPFIKG